MTIMIISGVGILVLLLIVVTVMQQKNTKVESDKRVEIARLTITIDDTEETLAKITNIPVTKGLMMVLHNRILETTKSIQMLSNDNSINSQVNDRQNLLESISTTFKSQGLDTFKLPNDDREVLQMVQLLKKLKAIINNEHKRGRINPEVFANEIKRADLMQIRININSIIKRAKQALEAKQTGSARTYLEKAVKTLKAINSEGDAFVNERLAEASKLLASLDKDRQDIVDKRKAAEDAKSSTDLDILFQPKKKW